jgi:hypothetical protein
MESALLAARTGAAPRRGSPDQHWMALSLFERGRLEREAAALTGRGVRVTPSDGRRPLFHTGPYESIGEQVVAVCGPVQAPPDAVWLAEVAARAAVDHGAAVVTGDTAGPEAAAHAAAVAAGGLAVTVLAEGIVPAADQRHVVVSACAPGQPWSVDAVMARNATIVDLCTALVAVCPAGTGATVDAGMRALAAGRPVLTIGATPGGRLLVDYGAFAAVDEVELLWWLDTRLTPAPGAAVCARPTAVAALPC